MQAIAHVIDWRLDEATRQVPRLLAQRGVGYIAGTVGPGQSWRGPLAAWRALRKQPGSLHAWGPAALAAAVLLDKRPLFYTPPMAMSRRQTRWLKAALAIRPLTVLPLCGSQQRDLWRGGISAERCELLRPGIDFAHIPRSLNRTLQKKLGIDERDRVVLAIGSSSPEADHRLALWTLSILHAIDPSWRLLLWGQGPQVAQLQLLATQMLQPRLLISAQAVLGCPVPFTELLAAAEFGLLAATRPISPLPIVQAMARLAMVSAAGDCGGEFMEDRHTALMAPAQPRELARRLLKLAEEPELAARLRDRARAEVYDLMGLTRFVQNASSVYQTAATDTAGLSVAAPTGFAQESI